jgi:mono/diheme cytochrome c family protein
VLFSARRAFSVKRLLQLVLLFALAWLAFYTTVLRPKLTPVERGRRLAEKTGCFGCHGAEGTEGTADPGRPSGKVPSYRSLMMYAKNEHDVREWIRDGVTASRARSESWKESRKAGALHMPAFGKRLNASQIDDLVAFVMAASGEEAPEDSMALAGHERASDLGCTGCHGAGGRYARPNPGSLKGYIPPWDGEDFPDLVRDRHEFGEWVENGVTRRFDTNPAAKYFLRRAALHMPAYKRFVKEGDVDALWAYVTWLRKGQPHGDASGSDTTDAPGSGSP